MFLLQHNRVIPDQTGELQWHILQGQEYSFLHIKNIVESDDIGVVKFLKNFYLTEGCEGDTVAFL